MTTKHELRREMKALRAALGDARGRAKRCAEHFMTAFGSYSRYFVYLSFGTEAETGPLIERLLALGKEVYAPRLAGREMAAVRWTGETRQNRYGIAEPVGPPYDGPLDVAVVPLLAADLAGHRLGYGGGYYDRFLAERPMLKVGFCLEEQILEALPHEPHDIRLDALVTDRQVRILGGR